MNLESALQTYLAESRDLLQEMEDGLLKLEHSPDTQDILHAIFRAAHTIKGSAGLFGLDEVVSFSHGVETLLDTLRDNAARLNEEITALLLESRDHIAALIDRVATAGVDAAPDPALSAKCAALTQRLRGYSAAPPVPDSRSDTAVPVRPAAAVENDDWHISLRFSPDALRDGMDPLAFLRYLTTIGTLVSVTVVDDAIPAARDMDPERCYLGFEIRFRTQADKKTIEAVFEFVREGSQIHILPPHSHVADYIALIKSLPEEDLRLGEILIRCGSLTQAELDEALDVQRCMRAEAVRPLGDIVVQAGMIAQPVVEAAVRKQTQIREGKFHESQSVRVPAEKLDQLIDLIGELVIAGAGTALNAKANGDALLTESVSALTRLVEEVRDSVLQLRMVQIGATFHRFQRVVRDVSKELDKEIDLVITGAETELDKTVVEKIGDPLMHLVRNAIDHGVEPAGVRITQGKPTTGTVRLNAFHDSGSIIIEVSDDGAGLDSERILHKAIEKGLVQAGQQPDTAELYNLVFEPGFSTSETVTNLSGRGVGMDVVKRNITALNGTVELESHPGRGTTFRIRLPLTLAIIDGFLVSVEGISLIVPLDMVLECVEHGAEEGESSAARDYINLRGEVLPLVRLRELFGLGGQPPRRQNIIVVHYRGKKAGMVVDRLMGQFQTVIKPLGRLFSQVMGVSGSTILGNGEVALIIDVPGLVRQVLSAERRVAAVFNVPLSAAEKVQCSRT